MRHLLLLLMSMLLSFRASDYATGTTDFVNTADGGADRALSAASDTDVVKSLKEIPHDNTVIHISSASNAADAPKTGPSQPNLTTLMSSKGCKTFASLLATTADAASTFQGNTDSGLTVFCPTDEAVKAIMPKFKNLTADDKLSLLLYHGVPVYYSVVALKSNNGVMNTLATDGTSNNFNLTVQNDGNQVTLTTKLTVARVTDTLIDNDPLAVHSIDEVLEPAELFKTAEAPAPAPVPSAVGADAAKAAAGKAARKSSGKTASPPAPVADSPNEKTADQKAADENAGRRSVGSLFAAAATAGAAALVMVA